MGGEGFPAAVSRTSAGGGVPGGGQSEGGVNASPPNLNASANAKPDAQAKVKTCVATSAPNLFGPLFVYPNSPKGPPT